MNFFFRQQASLTDILEMEFQLTYRTGLSAADLSEMAWSDIDWKYGRLIKQLRDEQKARKEAAKHHATA